ncbi:MAG: N-6 DNA methylase [Candidatus Marinimicrobia bacterium]|nr:N-6 DNA methylase [Candidatus Neomarinimicrobiota bacterium]
MKELIEQYLSNLSRTYNRGDAREESYYKHLDELIKQYAESQDIKNIDITILPKKTEAGNPDFRIWDGKIHITGYIEAKDPSVTNLGDIEDIEQLKRYRSTFPNVILTNFYEFRLYRNGQKVAQVMIGRPVIAQKLKIPPPVENIDKLNELLDLFFSFSLPMIQTARSLAVELANRTRFLRDEVITVEMESNDSKGHKQIVGFYEAFKTYLIGTLTEKQFADLYAQTITYGLFAARTRVPSGRSEFNRRVAFDYIPHTIGILRDVFRFISLEEPPKSLQIIVEDIAEILQVTNVNKILHEYYKTGKGKDPIIHFYETFLSTYDPEVRERRGVYYTPEPVVSYIVRAVHSLLKSHFGLADGLASEEVKLLDPAGGTLTFPAEAIRLAVQEHKEKYGSGDLYEWIKKTILPNYYSFELMMAPYAIGHLKMGFIFEELGYKMADDERFQLYLTNTLEMEEIKQILIPGLSSLSEESHLAGKIKKEQPVLVILGNPPYSGISSNINEWTERLLKEDIDGTQSYYKVDGKPLGEKKLWLQDDYVKFLRFAQWKIQTSGYGIVGMITNHSYLDNPTFRGMRQSLMKTFDELYILDLHGNSLKKETTPEGGKDENVFDIRQGVAIALFVKGKKPKKSKVFHLGQFGLREEKYKWLDQNEFKVKNYTYIKPDKPWYFFIPRNIANIQEYLKWPSVDKVFPINVTGIITARDNLAIDYDKNSLKNKIMMFRNKQLPDEMIRDSLKIGENYQWKISEQREQFRKIDEWENYFTKILYRPFDIRHIYYQDNIVFRPRREVMRHMLEENIGIVTSRQAQDGFKHVFISNKMIEFNLTGTAGRYGSGYLFPLYIYPEKTRKDNPGRGITTMMLFEPKEKYGRKSNIAPVVFGHLETVYGKRPSPEEICYYVYGVLYSNIFRKTYAEFLKIDFPRVPFTADYKLFKSIAKLGNILADLHLLKSPLLDVPVARYQGSGDNSRIEKIEYDEEMQRIYINRDKYFESIPPQVWRYHIGGYQVLSKYLKDRKGRVMDSAPHYCRIITALTKTIEIQQKIDAIYPKIEKQIIEFN